MIPPTPENIRAALTHISPDLPREDWVRIGMAVKDGLDGDGFDLFDEWSHGGHTYSAADTRDTWKSIKVGGKVTVGTLFGAARQNGWKPNGEAHQETEAERQERKRRREARDAQEAKTKAVKAKAAAKKAAALWDAATSAQPDHPYLARKGVTPVSTLRELPIEHAVSILQYHPQSDEEPLQGRTLVVPVEIGGQLSSAELIDEAGRKSAIAGGPKSGGYWTTQPLPDGDGTGLTLLIGEGIATVLTSREAAGHLAVAALSAANLPKVAKILRERYPMARLIVLGDLGKGLKYAEQAARETSAVLAVPEFTPEQMATFQDEHGKQPTDFNDLAALAGLHQVRQQLEQRFKEGKESPPPLEKPANPPEPQKARLPRGYRLTDKGLYYIEVATGEDNKAEERKIYVCSPLRVTAETRSKDQNQWGRLLEWSDRDDHPHTITIPMSMLEGEPTALCALLADGGLIIGVGSKARNLLVRYVKECVPGTKARCVNRIGWHGRVYVLPTRSIGEPEGERVLLQTGAATLGDFQQNGSVSDWRNSVATLCANNSRMMTGIGTAFAAPLLNFIAGEESGGLHFRGDSSCGKSTVLCAAASVFGKPTGDHSFRKEWRATGNGLEGLATSRNDSLLILDEMGQVDGRDAGTIAYMLANGQPKLRMTDNTALRKAPSWKLLFLSSGEVSLADHMAAAGKKIKAGQESRLADIPAMPYGGFGVFNDLNGYPSGAALSVAIREAAAKCYGAVGLAFIEQVVAIQETLPKRLKHAVDQFVTDTVPRGASGQVDRVATRFGLVAAALELAGEFGLTGWEKDTGTWAVKACFNAWLCERGGPGDHEVTAILSQVRAFFEANGESRFADWDTSERVINGEALEGRIVANRVGFRRKSQLEGYTYYVLPEAFKREICAGMNPDRAAQVLREREWIEPDCHGKNSHSIRLPGMGKTTRCYVFTAKMWESP